MEVCHEHRHSIVSMRLEPGAQVDRGRSTLIVELSRREPKFFATSDKIGVIPREGDWYAVSTSVFPYSFNSERMLPYYNNAFLNQSFRLGFTCEFSARVAHLTGLQQWIAGRERVTGADMMQIMSGAVNDALNRPVQGMTFPEKPAYEEYVNSQADIEAASRHALFRFLILNGLCLTPHSFRITGFKKYFELL